MIQRMWRWLFECGDGDEWVESERLRIQRMTTGLPYDINHHDYRKLIEGLIALRHASMLNGYSTVNTKLIGFDIILK